MSVNDGGPAFPTESAHQSAASRWHYEGMTLRDYFAVHCAGDDLSEISPQFAERLMGEASSTVGSELERAIFWARFRARMRYIEADAMIAEREAGK